MSFSPKSERADLWSKAFLFCGGHPIFLEGYLYLYIIEFVLKSQTMSPTATDQYVKPLRGLSTFQNKQPNIPQKRKNKKERTIICVYVPVDHLPIKCGVQ